MTKTRARTVLLVLIVLVAFTGCEQIWDIVGGIFGGGGTDQADFQVTGVSIEADRIVVTIANNGDLGESGVRVVIYLSDNAFYELSDPEVGDVTTNLPAMQTVTIDFSFDDIDVTGIADGDYHVVARVDPEGFFPEASEFNNEMVSFDTVSRSELGGGAQQADFEITAVSIETDRIAVTIENNGELEGVGVLVSIHLSDDVFSDVSDPVVDSATTNLPAAQPTVMDFYYTDIDVSGIPDGNYYVVARVDPINAFPEASEFNNELVSFDTVSVSGGGSAGDGYEPDNTPAEAAPILVDGGLPQQHSIDPAGDEDWFYFTASGGETYKIETLAATGGTVGFDADTVIDFYSSSSTTTPLDTDDDGGNGTLSLLQYSVPFGEGGTYYVRVTHYNATSVGDYDISVVTVDTSGTIDVTVE